LTSSGELRLILIEKSASVPASAENDPLIGTLLEDRYRILSVVGRGGMGVVYSAKQEYMDRIVAVKMLQPQLVKDSTTVKRFEQEAKSASRLMHPNIITLHDYGFVGEIPYLVMDFVQGASLSELLKSGGQLGVLKSINIFVQVCDALEHAHRNGIVHRDLKPGNIMLLQTAQQKDFVKVVDFGVAKILEVEEEGQRLTSTGEIFGSPVYMSPEQCEGRQLDGRADLYSMGVVMFETLTGKLPLAGKNVIETITKHLNERPPAFNRVRPDLYFPDRLEACVMKALEKDPNLRQQSMLELKNELLAASPRSRASSMSMTSLTSVQAATSQDHRVLAVQDEPRSMKVPIIIGVLLAFVVVAATAFTFVSTVLRNGVHPMVKQPIDATADDPIRHSQSTPELDKPTDATADINEKPNIKPPPVSAHGKPHVSQNQSKPQPIRRPPPKPRQTTSTNDNPPPAQRQTGRVRPSSNAFDAFHNFKDQDGGGGSKVWEPRAAGSVNYENGP
jgi:serine/threonine protein kinase